MAAPIDSLPPEVLQQIFYSSIRETATQHDYATLQAIMTVCQRWNTASLSYPRLWSALGTITLQERPYSPPQPLVVARRLRRAMVLIQRSFPHPISFSLYLGRSGLSIPHSGDAISSFLGRLVESSPRWQEVELDITPDIWRALNGIEGKLDMLQKLTLNHYYGTWSAEDAALCADLFRVAPMLRSAKLAFDDFQRAAERRGRFTLPWAQLIHYEEKACASGIQFFPPLIEAKELTSYKCTTRLSTTSTWTPGVHLHPNLTRFHVNFQNSGGLVLLEGLHFPALVQFKVECQDRLNAYGPISRFITTSGGALEDLTIISHPNFGEDAEVDGGLARLLALCPGLKRLCVNHLSSGDFQALTVDGQNDMTDVLLPNLQSFEYRMSQIWMRFDEFNRMVESRVRHALPSRFDASVTNPLWATDHSWNSVAHIVLCHLERFPHPREHPELQKVYRWGRLLMAVRGFGKTSTIGRLAPSYLSTIRDTEATLKEMEEWSTDRLGLGMLYTAEIPKLLHKVVEMEPSELPGYWLFDYGKRFRLLYEKWKPKIIEDARVRRKWMRSDSQHIFHIHDNDRLRNDEEKVWEMVLKGHDVVSDIPVFRLA